MLHEPDELRQAPALVLRQARRVALVEAAARLQADRPLLDKVVDDEGAAVARRIEGVAQVGGRVLEDVGPAQSMNSSGPSTENRSPSPRRVARSISAGVAIPSDAMRAASFMMSACSRGTMNPGEGATRTGTLPACSSRLSVRSSVEPAVPAAGLTSTRGMRYAGLASVC